MDLMKHLPSFYYNSEEVKNIQASIGAEDDILKQAIEELLSQLFIETATWGLSHWEKYLGIDVDLNEPITNRRARVMTRLRGQGTTTKEMIKNVCRSFTGGEVEIIENSAEYHFIIKFVDVKGIPGNMDYLTSAIEEIKPAHLRFSFEYKYNVWNNLLPNTWHEISSLTWDRVKVI
nr:YmfQ family protein [uncultured Cellulosilyticum sp.]